MDVAIENYRKDLLWCLLGYLNEMKNIILHTVYTQGFILIILNILVATDEGHSPKLAQSEGESSGNIES